MGTGWSGLPIGEDPPRVAALVPECVLLRKDISLTDVGHQNSEVVLDRPLRLLIPKDDGDRGGLQHLHSTAVIVLGRPPPAPNEHLPRGEPPICVVVVLRLVGQGERAI
jgi:hypothetical protein